MKRALRFVIVATLAACAGSTPSAAPEPRPQPASAHSSAVSKQAEDPSGGETILTTRRWVYAEYFNGLKRKVGAAWKPAEVWKALPESTRTALGTVMRETIMEVELSMEGAVTRLAIRQSSGVAALDVEAIRAFQVSSPYGAPPHGEPLRPFRFGFRFDIGSGASTTTVAP